MTRAAAGIGFALLLFSFGGVAHAQPRIDELDPSSATAGGPGFTLTIRGSDFRSPVVVFWNLLPLAGQEDNRNRVTVSIPATLIASPGVVPITVLNGRGELSNSVNFTINVPPPVMITSTSLAAGRVGAAYSQTLSASGGSPPYTWERVGGNLPPGVTLSSAGTISGTPTSSGSFNFNIQVRDQRGDTAMAQFTIAVAAALIISSSGLPDGTVGVAYNQTLSATGGTAPYAWSIVSGSLPPGVTLNGSTGQIAGTPSASGTFSFTAQAVDATSASATQQLSIRVIATVTISTPAALPSGLAGTAYSSTLSATGGTQPYTWSLSFGSLPPGLSLSPGGQITGTPTAAGTFDFGAQVADSASATANRQFTLIIAEPLAISTTSLPGGTVGAAYSQTLAAQGGTPPYRWAVSGSLPAGLTMSQSGTISGTPTAVGTANFTVQVTDAVSATRTRNLAIAVAPPVSISTTALPGAVTGTQYSQTLSATGGTAPYTWSVSAGALPAGLSLSGGGVLSGTPTAAGTAQFTVRVTDAASGSATRALAISVIAPVAITSTTVPGGTVGTPYSQTLTATGGTPPYTWTVAAGSLPAGLTVSPAGVISGTPTGAGTANFTVRATDAASLTATQDLSITVAAELTVATSSLPNGVTGAAYNATLSAAGGRGPYTWSLSAGSLPPGLALNSASGAITGTPSRGGNFGIVVQVTDAANVTANKSLSINVASNLAVVNTTLPNAFSGVAYSQTLTATGGSAPYRWSVTEGSLPPGLSLNPTSGTISGTTSSVGSFAFTVQVSDAGGTTASRSLTLVVTTGLTITTTSPLPTGAIGAQYSQALAALGGAPPYTWTIRTGSLPPGLTLNASNGVISGTPTAAGNSTVTIRVTDATSNTAEKEFALTIVSALAIASNSPLPGGSRSVAYSQTLSAVSGTPPYRWSIVSGSLPPGLALDGASGAITGTPTTEGTFAFTVQVTDAANKSVTKEMTLIISGALTVATPAQLPSGTVGSPYSQSLAAAGGVAPYTWALTSGSLPDGLTLNASTGVISGTPARGGGFTFTVQVTDAARSTASANLSLGVGIEGMPVVTVTGLPATVEPLQQPKINIGLATPYTVAISGQVVLGFEPDAAVPADDAAIQFSTGGRTANFTIAPNSTTASFSVPELALQTGTVAGTITLTVNVQAAGVPVQAPDQIRIRVIRSAPVIRSVSIVRNATGFEVLITGFSTSRELTQAGLRFTPSAGSDLQTTEVTLPFDEAARRWYQDPVSALYGSQFTIVQPFTVQGNSGAVSSVSVTLSNNQGTSQPVTATF